MQQPAPEIAPWMWFVFGITIVALLAVDHLAHRGERAKSRKVALVWSIVWIAAGLGFNFFVWAVAGAQAASEYLAVYLIEKSLSTDNMFLFLVIFVVIAASVWASLRKRRAERSLTASPGS